jgi:hypothetical protein
MPRKRKAPLPVISSSSEVSDTSSESHSSESSSHSEHSDTLLRAPVGQKRPDGLLEIRLVRLTIKLTMRGAMNNATPNKKVSSQGKQQKTSSTASRSLEEIEENLEESQVKTTSTTTKEVENNDADSSDEEKRGESDGSESLGEGFEGANDVTLKENEVLGLAVDGLALIHGRPPIKVKNFEGEISSCCEPQDLLSD